MTADPQSEPGDYQQLLSLPDPPRFASWIKHATRRNLILVARRRLPWC